VIDWFHLAMRFTVLKQMAKSIQIPDADPKDPDDNPGRLLDFNSSPARLFAMRGPTPPYASLQAGEGQRAWGAI
jgi:hypothetical protein